MADGAELVVGVGLAVADEADEPPLETAGRNSTPEDTPDTDLVTGIEDVDFEDAPSLLRAASAAASLGVDAVLESSSSLELSLWLSTPVELSDEMLELDPESGAACSAAEVDAAGKGMAGGNTPDASGTYTGVGTAPGGGGDCECG